MKRKKNNPEVQELQKQGRQIASELKILEKEYKKNNFKGDSKLVNAWIESFPIETLRDLINSEKNIPLGKFSLKTLKIKTKLRKQYEKKVEELEKTNYKLYIAKIDQLLDTLKKNP